MNLSDYFENTQGLGILATADSNGKVDLAIYARPHVTEDNTLAFIMRQRLSHQNLKSNPHAAYMFVEKNPDQPSPAYQGKRLYLTKISEETNTELVKQLSRRTPGSIDPRDDAAKFVVFFRIDEIRPLVGTYPPA
ncbi:MAG: pyridoxamine 5'-phosphate oxidase family protein [Sedimentisphaerales bacterium]|nr:pyridoxamine 5'-phosphate oxidase family protein [Sedimentisphaerales bacterium]